MIETAAQVYGLIEHEGLRRMIGREVAADGTPVLIFAEAPERDLDVLLLAGPMPEHAVWALARRIALALATLHRFGLAHQHVCPSAVRVRDDGTPLLEFAWLDVAAHLRTLDAACAPPELGREPLDASSDVYAFGALLRVLLLGRSPAAHDSLPRGPRRVIGALGVETYASNRVMGLSLRWRAHPFEWVEGRRWGVLRVFDGGVMHWFTVELELVPKAGGGTLLRYSMTLEPRHLLGKWIVALEMRLKQRPALARVFARIDAHARKIVPAAESSDAFEAAPPLTDAQRLALTRGIEQLSQDGVAPALLDALAKFCEQASDQQIAQLRPLEFARERGLDADALVDLGCQYARIDKPPVSPMLSRWAVPRRHRSFRSGSPPRRRPSLRAGHAQRAWISAPGC